MDRKYWSSVAVSFRLVRESLTDKVPFDLIPEVSREVGSIHLWKSIYLFQPVGRASAKTTSMATFGMFEGWQEVSTWSKMSIKED